MGKTLPVFFAFLLLAGGQAFAAATSLDLSEAQRRALGVETQAACSPVANSRFPARVVVPPTQMRVLAAPVGGLLEMLAVVPGQPVRRGQVIARLNSREALELQRDVRQSAAQATLARQNLERDEQLFAEGLIAESRLQQTRAAASQAIAQHDERQRGLQLAGGGGKSGEALALVAPIDGVILEQDAQLGQRVEAAAVIYRIARLSPLWLEIQAPLGMAADLRPGLPLTVVNPSLRGKLVAVGRTVDPLSQGVVARGEIVDGADLLLPGQVVEVKLDRHVGQGVQAPVAAIVRIQGKPLVFVQGDAPGRFEARPVTILSQGGGSARIDGVKIDEQVVIKGASGLKAMLEDAGSQ